jgi:hypothetical protein
MINIPLFKNQQSIVPQTNIKDIAKKFIVGFMAKKSRKTILMIVFDQE